MNLWILFLIKSLINESKKKKVNIVTLGCYKNLVDSEQLLRQLEYNHFEILHNSETYDAKIVIINTCGFILEAKQESINTILSFVDAKKRVYSSNNCYWLFIRTI